MKLRYRNKATGEEKLFERDQHRNYLADDGFIMSKSQSYREWTFLGKSEPEKRIKPHASKNRFLIAKERINALRLACEMSNSDTMLDYVSGFGILAMVEGVR